MAQKPISIRFISFAINTLSYLNPLLAGQWAVDIFSTPQAKKRRNPEALNDAKRFTISSTVGELSAFSWGQGEKTIVLMHGWESDATSTAPFIQPLVAAGYRVVSLDGPAHGDSPGNRANLLKFEAARRATIAASGDVYAVIGHSFGGAATLLALGSQPRLDVERAVIVGAPSQMDHVFARFTGFLDLNQRVLQSMFAYVERNFGRPMHSFNGEHAIRSGIPLMVIHDRTDPIVPFADAEHLVAKIPYAQAVYTEGLGHRNILKDQAVIGHVLSFLQPTPVLITQ